MPLSTADRRRRAEPPSGRKEEGGEEAVEAGDGLDDVLPGLMLLLLLPRGAGRAEEDEVEELFFLPPLGASLPVSVSAPPAMVR